MLYIIGIIFILYLAVKFGRVYTMLEENEKRQNRHRRFVESQIKIMHDNLLRGTKLTK